ncbi:MAG: TolC family protein [Prevotella sp.]|nr:TolC family protein [Prevotella sp.]MBO5157133.1 TolC family protein [Prevotella sp.]
MKHYTLLYIICAAALITGCGTYSKYHHPDMADLSTLSDLSDLSDMSDTSDWSDQSATPDTLLSWRMLFTDRPLQSLIDSALTGNADLRIASLRVAEAEASLKAARLAYLPSLSFSPQGSLSSYDGSNAAKTYNLALSAEWEIEFAGRLTAAKRGAKASAEMYHDARQAVRTQLIATVANSYYNLLALDAQLEIIRRTLDSWQETVRTMQARKEVGEANDAAVTQAKANMLAVKNDMVKISQQISQQENAVCLLLGTTPRHIPRTTLDCQSLPDKLCTGIPLQLLAHRPDVRQAEHALQLAYYNTNVARAAFYPQVSLSGTLGWANSDGSAIVNPAKWLTNAIGSLVQPIFSKGRNQANLRIAKAQQEEALIAFRQQLLKAGSEVNDALTAWQHANERLEICRSQKEMLRQTVSSTSLIMSHSEDASYLEVLTAQQSLLQAELAEKQELFGKIQAIISLYHAIGGGE